MRLLPGALLLSLLAASVPPGLADHETLTFVARGTLTAGNPVSDLNGGAAERTWQLTGKEDLFGIESTVVALPAWAPGHLISVTGTSTAPHDLDLSFYGPTRLSRGSGTPVDGRSCRTLLPDETCKVPPGSAYVAVRLWTGALVDWSLTVTSILTVPPEPEFIVPIWRTWNKTHLNVVIVPSGAFPIFNHDGWIGEGVGAGLDSPYVLAAEQGTQAWRSALDTYAASHAAPHLTQLTWTTRVVGRDATALDAATADIRIVFGFTYSNTGGTASPAASSDESRFDRCVITIQQWATRSFSANDTYTFATHEFGHCLGVDHPKAPWYDLMEAGYDHEVGRKSTSRACISNLDVRALDVGYAWIAGGVWEEPPRDAALPQASYLQYPADPGVPCSTA